jgi:hypothetical protein
MNKFIEEGDGLVWKYTKITPEQEKQSEKMMNKFYIPGQGKPKDSVQSAPIDNRQVP